MDSSSSENNQHAPEQVAAFDQATASIPETIEFDLPSHGVAAPAAQLSTPASLLSPESAAALIAFPFDFLSARAGKHWELTEAERRNLGIMAAPLVEKWTAKLLGSAEYAPELMFGLALTAAISLRMAQHKEVMASRKGAAPLTSADSSPESGKTPESEPALESLAYPEVVKAWSSPKS